MSEKPPIIISSQDADRLDALLDSLDAKQFPGRDALLDELQRAEIVESNEVPSNVVTMNSTVRFKTNSTGEAFSLTLVYPRNLDSSGEKISVLAPVGSAMLGLSEGSEIEWPKPGGTMLKVHVDEILYQPERAGDWHR